MNTTISKTYAEINEKYGKYIDATPAHSLQNSEIFAEKKTFFTFMNFLKCEMSFDMLFDHIVVDYIKENIFHLVYHLYSTKYNRNVIVVVEIPRSQPVINTVCSIWSIAEWQERESYDLFGILYNNHPDLRRIFLEDDWIGYPLRKNYQDNFMLEK